MNKSLPSQPIDINIGDTKVTIEIPANLYDQLSCAPTKEITYSLKSHTGQSFATILRGMLPKEDRPPTAKQEGFAKAIADQLGIEVPNEALTSVTSCSAFIDEHMDAFELSRQVAGTQQDKPPTRRVIYYLNKFLDHLRKTELSAKAVTEKLDLEATGDLIGVRPSTVKKYARDFKGIKHRAGEDGTWHVKNIWLEEYKNGASADDIYTRYTDEVLHWFSSS